MLVFPGDAVVNNQAEGGTLWQRQLSKLLCKIVEFHSTQAHSWHLQCYRVSLAGSNLGGPCLSSSRVAQMVKVSAYNAGDPGSIPGSGSFAGEGIGYPLQYSWASLVAQLVKNLPAMWETWVRSLSWEDPLEKGKATHSSILAWKIPWTV